MKNVIITILAILVIGLGGYLVYDKCINTGKENKAKENKTEEVKKFNENDLDKYVIYRHFYGTFDEGYKNSIVVENLNENDFISFDCSEHENDGLFVKEENSYIDYENNRICTGKRVTYSTLNKKYKELFGNKQEFSKSDFNVVLTIYAYDFNKDYFELFVANGTGLEDFGGLFSIVTNIEYKDSKAIVDAKIAKYGCYGKDCAFDGELTDEGISPVDFNLDQSKDEIKKIAKEKYMDKFDTYEFTFFIEDGIYKLESFSKK